MAAILPLFIKRNLYSRDIADDDIKECEKEQCKDGLTEIETYFSIINGIMGTGILAMGFVFRCAGFWALFIVPVVAMAGNYTGKILVEMLYETDKYGKRYRSREGYLDLGELLIPRFGKYLVDVVNTIENFAHSVLVLLLAGGVMHEIVPMLGDHLWTVLCVIPVLPIVFLERIHSLSKIAIVTVTVATVLVLISCIHSILQTQHWIKSFKSDSKFDLKAISLGIGITIVTYACQPYLPFIEKSMNNRENFGRVMNISYILVTILKLVSGLLAYIAYVNLTPPIMTSELPRGPLRTLCSLLLVIVALTFFIFPMFTVFTIFDENWPKMKATEGQSSFKRHVIRSLVLILAVAVAVVIPHFGLGVALVGNLTANMLMFILPCSCHIKLNYPSMTYKALFLDVLLLLTSTVFGSIGIVFSMVELVASFMKHDDNPTEAIEQL